jgi:integrase
MRVSEWQPKDGEARDIPICTPLLELLKKHRQVDVFLLQAEKGRPGRRRGGKGWLYRYDPKKVWLRVMKQVVAAGGKAITMYGMRHRFASNFLIPCDQPSSKRRTCQDSQQLAQHRSGFHHRKSSTLPADGFNRGCSSRAAAG